MQIKVTNTATGEVEIIEADGFEGNTLWRAGGRGTQYAQYPEEYTLEEITEGEVA